MHLRDSIQTFLEQTKAWAEPATLSSYGEKLARFALFAGHAELSTALILEYKAELFRAKLKESSIAGYFSTLSLFLKWCVDTGLLTVNPMPDRLNLVIAPSQRLPITADEFNRLVAAARKIQGYEHWPLAINIAWHTGLRLSDIALLRNVSLNSSGCAIRLIPKKTRRHARLVEIPIPEDLMALLAVQSKGDYVFPEMARMYKATRHKSLSAQFSYLSHKAGVHKSVHCFRHAFISRNLTNGVSPVLISAMTGINLKQVMTYTTISLETKRAALGLVRTQEQTA